jgi:hypothetical protein
MKNVFLLSNRRLEFSPRKGLYAKGEEPVG